MDLFETQCRYTERYFRGLKNVSELPRLVFFCQPEQVGGTSAHRSLACVPRAPSATCSASWLPEVLRVTITCTVTISLHFVLLLAGLEFVESRKLAGH